MNVKQKFFSISGVAGLIMAIVSVIGYFTASSAVSETLEKEIVSTIKAESEEAESWLLGKGSWHRASRRFLRIFPLHRKHLRAVRR